ncbi:hypothetical protein J6590_007916 [Homalodisca vitripennis]|nr:hypothetical protein J6590_007916 [Homalodisca vitripennis]
MANLVYAVTNNLRPIVDSRISRSLWGISESPESLSVQNSRHMRFSQKNYLFVKTPNGHVVLTDSTEPNAKVDYKPGPGCKPGGVCFYLSKTTSDNQNMPCYTYGSTEPNAKVVGEQSVATSLALAVNLVDTEPNAKVVGEQSVATSLALAVNLVDYKPGPGCKPGGYFLFVLVCVVVGEQSVATSLAAVNGEYVSIYQKLPLIFKTCHVILTDSRKPNVEVVGEQFVATSLALAVNLVEYVSIYQKLPLIFKTCHVILTDSRKPNVEVVGEQFVATSLALAVNLVGKPNVEVVGEQSVATSLALAVNLVEYVSIYQKLPLIIKTCHVILTDSRKPNVEVVGEQSVATSLALAVNLVDYKPGPGCKPGGVCFYLSKTPLIIKTCHVTHGSTEPNAKVVGEQSVATSLALAVNLVDYKPGPGCKPGGVCFSLSKPLIIKTCRVILTDSRKPNVEVVGEQSVATSLALAVNLVEYVSIYQKLPLIFKTCHVILTDSRKPNVEVVGEQFVATSLALAVNLVGKPNVEVVGEQSVATSLALAVNLVEKPNVEVVGEQSVAGGLTLAVKLACRRERNERGVAAAPVLDLAVNLGESNHVPLPIAHKTTDDITTLALLSSLIYIYASLCESRIKGFS